MSLLRLLAVAAVAAWLGIALFFSVAGAPTVFRVLERGAAGALVAALLPAYYRAGIALGALATVALALEVRRARAWRGLPAVALAASMTALLAWSALVTLPDAEAARQRRDHTRFAAAHRAAVALNLASVLCGAAVLGLETVSRRRGA